MIVGMGRDRPCNSLMCRYEPPRVGILPLLDTVCMERICGCLVGWECTLLRDTATKKCESDRESV